MKATDTIAMVLKNKSENRILAIAPEQLVYDALELLAEHDVGALLVISNQRIVGILSERDHARKGILLGQNPRETKVHQIMTSPVISVSPEHTVDECMALMTEKQIRHVPVVEGKEVMGVVSNRDVVQEAISHRESLLTGIDVLAANHQFPT